MTQTDQSNGDQHAGNRRDPDIEAFLDQREHPQREAPSSAASARNSETETLSSDWMNTRNAPGQDARHQERQRYPPQRREPAGARNVVEASSRDGSSPCATTTAARYISGPKTTTCR